MTTRADDDQVQGERESSRGPLKTPSDEALAEAEACLSSLNEEGFFLDNFNLLGVVATPGGTPHYHHHQSSLSRSQHQAQRQENSSSTQDEGADAPYDYYEYFTGTVQTLESTIGQVTEQIDTLNMFLEELSREYLGDYGDDVSNLEYYLNQDEDDDETAHFVPPELANMSLDALQGYLQKSGVLAHSFRENDLHLSLMARKAMSSDSSLLSNGLAVSFSEVEALEGLLSDLPPEMVEEGFDLMDSETFCKLLLAEKGAKKSSSTGIATETSEEKNYSSQTDQSLSQPTSDLFGLSNPERLSHHLDKVELALLDQVRQRSDAFFKETTRFRQLSAAIVTLIEQTTTLRSLVRIVLNSYKGVANIPSLDQTRKDLDGLVDILEAVHELVQVKASIGGLVSANDHLTAAEQIEYGRKLLNGKLLDNDASDVSDQKSNQDAYQQDYGQHVILLDHLSALQSCSDQFEEYQRLVVQSLSDEVTELFLNWRTSLTGRIDDHAARVPQIVQALQICNAVKSTGETYTRRVHQTLRMAVRTTIAEFVDSESGGSGGVTGMTHSTFIDCLELLLAELSSTVATAKAVDTFCEENNIFGGAQDSVPPNGDNAITTSESSDSIQPSSGRWSHDAVVSAAELATKSIAEILRLRKEAHSFVKLDEMRELWDRCLDFTISMESTSGIKAVNLRSTMMGQAKAFLERNHESNMSALAAALDSERWTQCEVSVERQDVLTRLCSGRAVTATSSRVRVPAEPDLANGSVPATTKKNPTADVEGVSYKVVWSCLLAVEMIMTNLSAAAHFQSLATNSVTKVSELLRLFNTRSTQLVLGAGAIHSAARLKSINAKHLSLVTQCLGMMLALLPHIRAALMAQLPSKQHMLLADLDKIQKEYRDHNEKVLNKFVSIIGGIVEHGLAPRIAQTDFDARAKNIPEPTDASQALPCCVFLEGVSTNTKKMHQVLSNLLPPDHLQDVFSRIFAYVDQKVPALFIAAADGKATEKGPSFKLPETDLGKQRMLAEIRSTTSSLNALDGVLPWEFSAASIIERRLNIGVKSPPVTPKAEDESGDALSEEPKAGKEANDDDVQDSSKSNGSQEMSSNGGGVEADISSQDVDDDLEKPTDAQTVEENGA